MPPDVCPHCGADVPPNAKSCPECGSDKTTGWSEEAKTGDLGLPDEEFDYNEYVKREFGKEAKPHGISWLWWSVAIVLILLFLFFFFH